MKNFEQKPQKFRRRNRQQSGFTVVELVLVLAILGLLATVVITRVGGIFGSSQIDTAKFHVNQTFKTPLLKYRIDVGTYPSTDQGLQALKSAPDGKEHLWKGPYVETLPTDPWKNPYRYSYPGEMNDDGYDIRSAGPDGQFNTSDDIGNWETEES